MIDKDRLVWLDMEMTGLDPSTCVPLEVAVIITDSQCEELAAYESVVKASPEALEQMSDFVREMHTRNGLLEKVRAATSSLEQVEDALLETVKGWCVENTAVLAGNSIWQDRRFLREYFPRFNEFLHYRMIDVSTIKELVKRWYGDKAVVHKDSAHTAMSDIRASMAELAKYRETVFRSEL